MPDSTVKDLTKITIRKDAAAIAPVIRERAVREFRFYGSTRKMQRRDGLSRSDVQDLVLLGLIDEIRRLRPLQRRRKMQGRRAAL